MISKQGMAILFHQGLKGKEAQRSWALISVKKCNSSCGLSNGVDELACRVHKLTSMTGRQTDKKAKASSF